MADYFICEKHDVVGHSQQFKDTHWIDLPDGRILVAANFHSEYFADRWMGQGHIEKVAHDDEPVSSTHGQILNHLGVKAGHSKDEVRKHVKKTLKTWGN